MTKRKKELSTLEKKFIDYSIKDILAKKGHLEEEDLVFIANELDKSVELVREYFEGVSPVESEKPTKTKKVLTEPQSRLRSMMNLPTAAGKGNITVASEAAITVIEDSIKKGNSNQGANRHERNIFRGNK